MYSRVTDYIAQVNPDLQPIMDYIRQSIHEVYPEIEENIKWGAPSFEINGKIICSLMAFKKHINFLFKNVGLEFAPYASLEYFGEKSGMMGVKHITSLSQLPNKDLLKKAIQEAIDVNS